MKTIFLVALLFCTAFALKGVVELDEITFPKVVDGSRHVLVAYVEYSWKDPKDFEKLNDDFPDVLLAKIDVSDDEARKSEFSSLPAFKFYAKGSKEAVSHVGDEDHAVLSDFVRLQLNPKLVELKKLASSFVSGSGKRVDLQKEAEKLVGSLEGADKEYAQYFVTVMKKIQEKGDDFVATESTRLSGLVDNKSTSEKKRHEFNSKLNIVKAFAK